MYAPGLQVMKMFVCGYGLLTFSCIFHLTHLAQYKDDGVGVPGCEKLGQGENSHPPPRARAQAYGQPSHTLTLALMPRFRRPRARDA